MTKTKPDTEINCLLRVGKSQTRTLCLKNVGRHCLKWPDVDYGNIYNYLVNTPGLYTQKAMQAYKSLEGYNFFVAGHVQQVLFHEVQESSVCILMAKVIPSQKVTDKKQWHKTWLDKTRKAVILLLHTVVVKQGKISNYMYYISNFFF